MDFDIDSRYLIWTNRGFAMSDFFLFDHPIAMVKPK